MIYKLILPKWAQKLHPEWPKVLEGEFSEADLEVYNREGYNLYFYPNCPTVYHGGHISGKDMDHFEYVFVDMDLKDEVYPSKEEFVSVVEAFSLPPSFMIDTGNGVHVYWQITDLDGKNYLRLCRRLMRHFKTDSAVGQIQQVMRLPDSLNTKDEYNFKPCTLIEHVGSKFTCEELDKALPKISHADEEFCEYHYDTNVHPENIINKIDLTIPSKFAVLLRENTEVKAIWSGEVEDRSTADFKLGRIMFGHGFGKDEALSVLANTEKARERLGIHQINYAKNIVEKIWNREPEEEVVSYDSRKSVHSPKEASKPAAYESLSVSVRELLEKPPDTLAGTRLTCSRLVDATARGFRLGDVMGLVAGSGVGKTTFALNLFRWFVQNNSDYVHLFVSLEQPDNEIAMRWSAMCGEETHLHDRVQVLGNYNKDGSYRNLSLADIEKHIVDFEANTSTKIGCVVIDHIGVLKKKSKDGAFQGLMELCEGLKAFAIRTRTFLVMQSQTSREKAGIGDVELNKDAAYGTTMFEWFCDYLMTIWQPLKRCYENASCPPVTAFKFAKIRFKNRALDEIKEDMLYRLVFDPLTERFRELTQQEATSFEHFNKMATNQRKADRKLEVLSYKSHTWLEKDKGDVRTS